MNKIEIHSNYFSSAKQARFVKLSFLIAFLNCIILHAYSQRLVPQVGFTLSKSTLGTTSTQDVKATTTFTPGFMAGLSMESPIAKGVNLQSGVFFVQKGYTIDHVNKTGNYYQSYNYNFEVAYAAVPILARINLNSRSKTQFYLKTGPELSCFLSGKVNFSYFEDPMNGNPIQQRESEYKIIYKEGVSGWEDDTYYIEHRFDIGFYMGAGVSFNNKVHLDIGATQGFISNEYYFNKIKATNQVVQFSIGVPINSKSYNERLAKIESAVVDEEKRKKNKPRIYLGLSAGQSLTEFTGSEVNLYLNNDGIPPAPYLEKDQAFTMAMVAKFEWYNYFFLKSGLHYIRKGSTVVNDNYPSNLEANVHYLTIPLLVGFQPVNFDNARFINMSIEAGISSNIQVSADMESLTANLYPGTPIEIKNPVTSAQIGLNLEIKVSEQYSAYANYTYYKDLQPFYRRGFFDLEHDLKFQGQLVSVGIMKKL
jgi:hypothetical protein